MIEDVGAVEECAQAIKAYLGPIGALPVAPPVLQPAGLYLELIGETIRRRAVLTRNDALCLRPDMTIPAARLALSLPRWHGDGFSLMYDGRVFRRLPGTAQPIEPRQIGVEWYAPPPQSPGLDARMLLAALGSCQAAGADATLVLGCAGLSRALIEACALPPALSRSLLRSHAVRDAIAAAREARAQTGEENGVLGALLAQGSAAQANALMEEVMALAGVSQLGGRPLQEVAERLRRKALLVNQPQVDDGALCQLSEAFAIEAEPLTAFAMLRAVAAKLPEPGPAIHRVEALERLWSGAIGAGLKPRAAVFRAAFDRSLEYYDGLAFDLVGASGGLMGGGGRYDQVLPALARAEAGTAHSASTWGAAGFSLYPAVIAAERAP